MALDTTGLKPLDVSGLEEADGLDTAGLVELDVSGLEPADGQPGTIAEIGQNVAEFGKGIPRGAGTTIGGALKGFGALLETASPELRPYLDELSNLDTSNAEAVADLRRRADQGLRGKDRFTFHSAMSDVLEGADTGESLRAQLAKPVTETAGYRAGKAIEEASDIFPAAPGYEQSIGRQLGEGVGSVVAGVGVGLLPGGQVAGPAMFTLAGAGEAVDRAIQNGATEEQIVEAARLGTLAGMTDSVPVETLLGRIPVPGAGFVKVPANMLGTALKAVGRIGWQATIEGIQEGGQQFLQNLIAREVYKPDQDLTEDVLPSGGIGAGVGAITETGRMAIANFGGRRRPKGEREKAAEQPPTLTQDDIESPIPNDLIAEGKKVLQEADATKRADDILSAAGLPGVGSRVTIDYGDGRTQSGVIDDAFTGEAAEIGVTGEGVKIKLDDGTTFEEFFDTLAQSGARIMEEGGQNTDLDAVASDTTEQTPEIEPETEAAPEQPAALDTTDLEPVEEAPRRGDPAVFATDANGVLEQEAPGYRFVPSQTDGMVDLIGPDGNAVLTARPPTSATLAIARRQARPAEETSALDTTDLLPLDQREQPDLLGGPTVREADAVADEQAAGLVEEARAELSDAEIRAELEGIEAQGSRASSRLPADVRLALTQDDPFDEGKGTLIGRMRAVLDRGEREQQKRQQQFEAQRLDTTDLLPVDLSAAEMADRLEGIAGAPQSESATEPMQPPAWFTERTPEGRRQLARAAGMPEAEAARVSRMNWANLSRDTETVARLENAAQAAKAGQAVQDSREIAEGRLPVEDARERQRRENIRKMEERQQSGRKVIGKNRDGLTLEEDERGVRSFVRDGIRISEPVGLRPGGGMSVDRTNRPEFQTTEENPQTDEPATVTETEPPTRDTVKPEEDSDGVQDRVSRSDAPAGAEDVQPAPAERDAGGARSGQERGSARDAGGPAAGRGEAAERGTEGPGRGETGRGSGDERADRVSQRDAEPVKGENFRIEPGALAEGRGWVQKARDNIRAIELMRQIEAEGRPATAEEQAQLALYVGWGGIRGAFPDTDGKFGKGFEEIGKKLKDLLTETEYATARRSIQYAHYTSETIVRSMWDAAQRLGFRGGKVFEPGMGVGNFAGMMPANLAEATMYNGLELDHTTARIARLLYPKWGVRRDDFTKAPLPKDTYDLVIGNPPFADIPIKSDPEYAKHSFLLHDYFFAKSLDAVRPGGLLMFVTSAGTMNKIDTKAREYMAERADLVGAVRLPGDAFEKNAGTSVTTDIIILRKRLPGEQAGDRSWVETTEVTLPNKEGKPTKGRVNRYFVEHPEMVLGEEGFFDKLYAGRYGVRSDGRDLGDALAKAMASLPENVMAERQTPEERAEVDFGTAERKEGSFYIGQDGKLHQMRDGVGRPVELRGKGVEGGVTLAAMERIKGLIPIRDALRAVYDADLKGDAENAAKARERLNGAYDRFVQRFGPINKAEISYRRPNVIQQEAARSEAREEARFAGLPFDEGSFDPTDLIERGASLAEIARQRKAAKEEAEKAGREWSEGTFDPDDMPDLVIDKRPNVDPFMDDPESYRLRAIERYNDETGEAQKTAVFYENVITREKAPEIRSVGDALLFVLNKRGRVDLAEIAQAAGVSESEAVEQLGNAIFKVPGTETWQTREQYLSGNVRQKLRQAKVAAERNPEFQRNVEALEAVQPAPLPPSEINANLGMPWLPPKVIEDFGKSLGLERIRVRYVPALAQWFVEGDTQSAAATSTWGTSDRAAPHLISDALNRTDPKIYDTIYEDGKKKQVLNAEATQAAQDKVREIKERFAEWVWSDQARSDELAALYNEQYNNLVVPEYDGSYLTTPGISAHWQWRPHQKRAIARIIQSGNTYLAHAVGAGKTSEMIGAAMEMRRLGLVKKPMFAVPNHMLGQFTKEFYEQYPTARIAVADERRFHADRRKQFIADVANDDLDAVIITHSAFNLIPVSDEFQDGLIQEQIDEYRDLLEDTNKHDPEQRITRRRLENAIEKLEQRLSGKKGKRKDQVYTFEEMGVDFLFVDEAHLFRKLDFATKMSNVKGISPEGSKASFDLYTKTRYLETINPGRNLVLASGTPVTNTMAELYTVSRYMQPQELASRGLGHFDAWAGAFGDTVTQLEQDPAGGYKPVTRFAKFVNVPELSAMVRQVMDVVTSRQLEQYVTRPKLKGGKRQMNLAEKTEELDAYQQQLARRMQAIAQRKGPPNPGDDIILNVINDGRHAAIDMRLVDPTLPNDPGSKLNLLVDNVFRIWQETKRQPFHQPGANGYSAKPVDYGPATQMIFANLGVGDSRPFSVHRYIVTELVRRGVPKDEIALIADYKTHVAKQRLFNDMNEGKKRVLIGSTAKMATGVNAQRRLYALHNLDPLWYPADDEQRNGRIIRQGNMNPEVEIHDYSTKGTYDSTMWGLMETKARFIQGFFEGDPSIRDMEDLGEASQYEQAKAITTADPRLIELTDLKQQLEKARRRRAAFDREQYAVRQRIASAKSAVAHAEERIPQIEADIARRQDTSGDNFKATAGRKTYTDRPEFGEAIMGQIDLLKSEGKERKGVKLGEIGGFEIKADVRQRLWEDGKPWTVEVYIAREGGFDTEIKVGESARGLVQSLENALRNFEADLERQQRRKADGEKTIADYTPQLGKEFTGGKEIDDLAGRVRELEGQLAAEAQAIQQAQQLTEEGEKFSIRREFRGDLEKIAEQLQGRLRQLRIDDKIGLRLTEKIRSLSTGEAIPGVEGRYYRGLLQVALGARDRQWTLNHEAIHAMREIGLFREAEWRTLEKAAKADTARMDEIRRRYGRVRTLTEEALVEEAIADMFADWAAGRMQVRGFIRDAFERIMAFLRAVYDALTGNGYRTVDDIFMAVETGRVGRRRDLRGRFAQEMLTGIDETGPMGLSQRFMDGLESFAMSRSRTGDLIYSNEYRKRSADEMRMFERPARVVHAPASGTRPSGMPRPVWNDMVEKPWVIELPTAGNAYKQYPIRYRTEEEARSAVERMMPDEIERAAYRIASSPGLVDNLQKELEARGFSVSRDDAKTTESKYLYVDVGGTTVKMRFSGHSKTVFLGGTSRSHAAGYWDFSLGYSKSEGTQKIASIISLLEQARGQEKFMVAWHGSPHDFDQFKLDRIGTGEGAQAFGWGLYFAGNREVAEFYRRSLAGQPRVVLEVKGGLFKKGERIDTANLSIATQQILAENDYDLDRAIEHMGIYSMSEITEDRKTLQRIREKGGKTVTIQPGRLYQVNLMPKEDEYLLWDRSLLEQPEPVLEKVQAVFAAAGHKEELDPEPEGRWFYRQLSRLLGSDRAASEALRDAGIPGIKYLDGSSRRKGDGNYNYVIFDDSLVSIEEKFSIQRPARPAGASDTARFDDAKTEKRWQEARKGVAGQETLITQTQAWLEKIANGFTRHYIHLPNTREYSDVREQLRKLEAAPQASKEQVIRILRQITDGFTPADLDLFTRKVVLDDLAWEASQERDLPFGFTPEDVTREKAKIDAIMERRPDLAAAVRQRKLIVRKVANDLVAAGVLHKDQVKNPAYYRHQVLDYARATVNYAKGPGNKLRSPHWARRMGSTLDINANLLEAEFDWLHKAFTDIETAKTINWIKNSKHNIRSSVIAAAREHNNGLVQKALERDQEENGFIDKQGRQSSPLTEEWRRFKQRIAMGLDRVRKAIDNGELFVPEEFELAAGNLTGDFANDTSIFPFLAWIMDNDEAGAEGAALAFKAISQRKAWVKDLLGDRYADPNDVASLVKRFAPEGYVAWQPDEGKLLYTAKTLPEHVIDAMLDRIAKEGAGPLSQQELRGALESVRSLMAVGGDKFQMVIPEELAATLNSFRDQHAETLVEATLEVPMRWWKRWVLINPRRVIKYNINNFSGDLDAVIAGNPRAIKKMPQAIKELWQVMIKGQAPSDRYREAVERGVFDSGLSVQEIPDINLLSEFEHLIDKPSPLKRPDRLALGGLMKVWRALQKYTQFRENWLRYAAYLDYVERLEAGESMESIGYGAANPEMVDAVTNKKDRAALLARELVGDYGAVSHWGQHIRRKLIPFWSWMEINTKRYWRLMSNAYGQGVGRGLATTGWIGAAVGVRTTAWLGLRMVAMYTVVQLWNNLVFGDDEDELDPEERARLHLLLGRDDDGKIRMLRFQGAFSDALSWFGFEDVVDAASEIEKGRGDFGDVITAIWHAPVNKIASGLTPVLKLPIETATGQSFWPDVFKPMPIRDGWRHVAKSFAMEHEYDAALGKPTRGYAHSLEEAVVNRKDAGENAYNRIKGMTYDWLRKQKGQEGSSSFSTPRSKALYEWRLAKRYGDEEAARAARQKLRDLGVTPSDLEASIKRAHPLGALTIKDRAAFLRTLSDKERDLLDQANLWYRQTFTN